MKKCNMCGSQLQNNYNACPNCGNTNLITDIQYQPINNNAYVNNTTQQEGNIGWGFLGFFVPIMGLILFCLWKDEQPVDAKYAGVGALISTIISAAIVVLYFIIMIFYFIILFISLLSFS